MNENKRMKSFVELLSVQAGTSNRTAQYGAEYRFKTSTGAILYWDTNAILDVERGGKVNIGYNVVSKISDNVYVIKNVRVKK